MQPATLNKPFTQNASRAQGRESVRRNGERHYINHYPHFSVHYYPQKEPQEVWYREWDNEVIAYGWHLLDVYECLKANIPQTLAESEAPYDPDSGLPYIQMIEYRVRL
jgi:hypothetical protein